MPASGMHTKYEREQTARTAKSKKKWPPGICPGGSIFLYAFSACGLPSLREKSVTQQKIMALVGVSKLLVVFKKARIRSATELVYQRFLGLPVLLVLVVLWFAGLAILGSLGLVLYLYGALLVRVLTGG